MTVHGYRVTRPVAASKGARSPRREAQNNDARRMIDANGLVGALGFVDLHTH